MTLTKDQTKSLVDEFIQFVINDWTKEQLAQVEDMLTNQYPPDS